MISNDEEDDAKDPAIDWGHGMIEMFHEKDSLEDCL
jgi:hypothetical protein